VKDEIKDFYKSHFQKKEHVKIKLHIVSFIILTSSFIGREIYVVI